MAMTMESLYPLGQGIRQLVGQDTKATARSTGIIKFCLYLAILGVHPYAYAYGVLVIRLYHRHEALVLREGVESYMSATIQYGREIILGIGWTVGMSQASELAIGKQSLIDTAGRSMADILTKDGKSLPEGIGLESQDYLNTSRICNMLDQFQIATQQLFF
jgi:hypothetical protein